MTTTYILSRVAVPLLLTLVPLSVHAAAEENTETSTGVVILQDSGALLVLELPALRASLNDRIPESRYDVSLPDAKMKSWEEELGRTRQKFGSLRASCYKNIREANRDTLLETSATCLRGDLMLETSLLRKQSAYVSSLSLVEPIIATGAVRSIASLIDANMTLVGAIDSGLFLQASQLNETKKKLTNQYRIPYWLAMQHLRSDRQLIWIGLIVRRLEELMKEGSANIVIQGHMLRATRSLQAAATLLRQSIESADVATSAKAYNDAMPQLTLARMSLQTITRLQQKDALAAQSASASSKGPK